MAQCRWCGREGDWPSVCLSTRDMEEKPTDPICDAALLRIGGGERSVNRSRADQQITHKGERNG